MHLFPKELPHMLSMKAQAAASFAVDGSALRLGDGTNSHAVSCAFPPQHGALLHFLVHLLGSALDSGSCPPG